MTIKIENYAKMVEKRGEYDWYKWKVFVNEEEPVLSTIKEVIYLLHPTFRNPERVVSRRENRKFALESSGWGSFNVNVTIIFNDKSEEIQTYYLDLGKDWPE